MPLDRYERPEVAIVMSFGLFVGREATAAEIEHLARALLTEVDAATIRREQRYEIGPEIRAFLHEVVVEVADDVVADRHPLVVQQKLIEIASEWVRSCIASPGEPHTLAERLARQAVVDTGTDRERPPG